MTRLASPLGGLRGSTDGDALAADAPDVGVEADRRHRLKADIARHHAFTMTDDPEVVKPRAVTYSVAFHQ